LEKEINNILIHGVDNYKDERKRIKDLAFKSQDGRASEEIWELITEKFLR